MNENDIYFNESFSAEPQMIVEKVCRLFEQMRNRPLGLYVVRRWPTLYIEKNFETDELVAHLSARMTFIGLQKGLWSAEQRIEQSIFINPGVIANALREEDFIRSPIPRTPRRGTFHGTGRIVRSGWQRVVGFLFRRSVWKGRWRTARGLYHQLTGKW